jgi:L-lactate dehydrogenase complex protein LldG
MSDSRTAILGRIAATLGHAASAAAPEVVQRIDAHARGPQPAWGGSGRERFLAKLDKVAGTHAAVASRAGIAAAVADYLAAQGLPQRLVVAAAFCGIAETGSLMLLSGADSPTSLNFLPDDFLCVLPEDRIVPRLEDAWALLRAEGGALPRSTNLVTGPSRTADVEQTIQLGAHGPRRLHVLLLGPTQPAQGAS